MANRTQIQSALQKPYDRLLFGKEVLNPIFGTYFTLSSSAVSASAQPNKSEQAVIESVSIYGNINLEDGTEITCYEIVLQPSVRIEQSKVAIQRYVRKLLTAGQIALVNFIAPQNKKVWRLTLVAKDSELTEQGIKEKTTQAKRYTYLLGPSETCKTAAERFETLSTEKQINFQALVNAFSVEKLSKAFFDEYTLHYQKFCDYLQESNFRKSVFNISIPSNATKEEVDKACKPIRDFVKKLLGRIVFLYFVQKKGWMGASDTNYKDGLTDFIKQLFKQSGGDETFYSNWLTVLFFDTLNKERLNDDFKMPDGKILKVPFLNGGLFDRDIHDESILTFPKELFHNADFAEDILTKKNWINCRGFLDFLDAFNFTVHEDSPDDQTVAVDPEMLGHIFENLLEDNKDKGAFYTPKEIVHYMCQESLTEYLTTHLSKEYTVYKKIGNAQVELFDNEIKIGQLQIMEQLGEKALSHDDVAYIVKYKDISHLTKAQLKKIDSLLETVKICDPAIGSGAFPMGLLQEIHAIKEVIAHELEELWKPADVKENIIQKSIYGVDIEKGAVDIARLRFWLSLLVDEEKPRSLPNLDYKIVVGDSLVSKFEGEIIEIDWEIKEGTQANLFGNENVLKRQTLLKQITTKQQDYFHTANKEKLATDIRNLKIDILINQLDLMINTKGFEKKPTDKGKKAAAQMKLWLQTQSWRNTIIKLQKLKQHKNEIFEHFDWKLDFPEVLNPYLVNGNAGFDIVIGNPPYDVYEGKKKNDIAPILEFEIYHKCKGGKINAYELFLAKTHELIINGGVNCQIFQNSFLGDNAARGLREFYLSSEKIIFIDSFPERDNPKKRVFESAKMSVCILLSQKVSKEDYSFIVRFWKDRFFENGFTTNYTVDEIFKIDPKSLSIPSLRAEEKELFNRYYSSNVKYSDHFECIEGELNMTFHSDYMTSNSGNPLIIKGAQVKRFHVTNKPSQGKIEYVDEKRYLKDYAKSEKSKHHKEKRIAMQGISGANDKVRIISTLIPENTYCANSCNYIIPNSKTKTNFSVTALLGIFNSALTNWVFRKTSTNSNVNCYEVNNLRLPLPQQTSSVSSLEILVNYVIFLKNIDINNITDQLMPTYFEQIIDGIVYELYFPELIKKHKREIIQHLGKLPEFTEKMDEEQKMKICKTVFNRLNEREHMVRVNLFYMSSIPEIAIIEDKNENN